jgi:intracellular multiplication protein IcmL
MLWVSVACLVASIALTVVSLTQQQRNVYFATDQGGSLIRLVPLSEPNHKDAVISQWLARALTDTFNFNFSNLRFRLNEAAQKWFTSNGATELIQELRDNGTWQTIEERELIVSLSVDHVPLVIDKGPIANGRYYAWKLQAPATLTFRNTKGQPFTNKVVFTVVVQRRSMLEDPTGLGIAKIIMRNQER